MKRLFPLVFLACAAARAATLVVTSTGDDAADPATLRGAIAAAADGDTIAFDPSLAGATIALAKANGPLEYAGSLTIDGGAGAPVTIDGGAGATETGVQQYGGDGGDGRASDITGEEVWYAGGGGGAEAPRTTRGLRPRFPARTVSAAAAPAAPTARTRTAAPAAAASS